MKQKKETHAQSHCEHSVAIARSSNRRAFTLAEGATHVGTCDNVRKNAFTLAEVLITLAIIGVVAAMTIPTLVANYQEKSYQTKFRKTYNIMVNAIKLSEIDNGDYASWDRSLTATNYNKKYLLPYFKGARMCTGFADCGYESACPFYNSDGQAADTVVARDDLRLPIILPDGIYVAFSRGQGNSDGTALVETKSVLVDVNGPQAPNTFGKDVWWFETTEKGFKLGSSEKKILGF